LKALRRAEVEVPTLAQKREMGSDVPDRQSVQRRRLEVPKTASGPHSG
jgi:hypothetical protein